ncbi:MAG: LysR family transcriptional regulator [Verrucomicrobiota bacterium]
MMHRFLSTVPFDLYELALFYLVVKHGSFTKAAELAGLTQSAITRQIQGVESRLGIPLLERTTRQVRVTDGGQFLFREAARLLGDVEQSLEAVAQQFGGARKQIRVGVSRTIGLSYLPGFFHANLRRLPHVGYRVTCQNSADLLSAVEASEVDLGVLCPPRRLPKTVRVTHRFEDVFALIVPRDQFADAQGRLKTKSKARLDWVGAQNWLLIDEQSNTGQRLRAWQRKLGWQIEPTMQLDNFDLIISLVALGMGVSMVPVRALAIYNPRKKIARIPLSKTFSRELVVVVRKHRKLPEHLSQFIDNILF